MSSTSDDVCAIIQAVNTVATAWDAREFDLARQQFAPKVNIDYTSLGAPAPTEDDLDTLVGNWKAVLPGFDCTQHLIGSHSVTVDADKACCKSHVQAYHLLRGAEGVGNKWVLGGTYEHGFSRLDGQWKITSMKLTVLWTEGDQGLLVKAAERAAAAK